MAEQKLYYPFVYRHHLVYTVALYGANAPYIIKGHLVMRTYYIDAAKYARIAVVVKEDQPSINIGYTYYILAMSLEQLARKENSINAESEVQSIYSAYYSAYQYMEHGREHLKKSIRRQVMSLEFESKIPSNIDFSRIDKETDAETVNSINGLLKLLSDSDKE